MRATRKSHTSNHRRRAGVPVWLCFTILLCCMLVGAFGCNLFDAHVREFDLMRGMAADAASRLQDGSVGQAQISGQAVNPGVVVEAAIVYRAQAHYTGLAGQFMVATQGSLGRQVPWADILDIINNSATADEMRWRIVEKLMDTAQQSPTSQPSGGGAPGAAAPGGKNNHRPLAGATPAERQHQPLAGATPAPGNTGHWPVPHFPAGPQQTARAS